MSSCAAVGGDWGGWRQTCGCQSTSSHRDATGQRTFQDPAEGLRVLAIDHGLAGDQQPEGPPDLRQEGLGDGNRAVNGGAVTQLLGEIEQWGVSIRLGRAGGRATQRRRSALLAHELVETRGKLLEESVALLKEGIPTVLGGLLEALQLGTGLITGLAQLG